jgi:hypothetical protein
MNEQLAFEQLVDEWVSERLTETTDWDQLLCSLPSVYPGTVWESVRRLSLSSSICFRPNAVMARESSFAWTLWSRGKLLTPHPQDSLWWFGDVALERLLWQLRQPVANSGGVLLLGTPSLFHYAKAHALDGPVLLLDRDSSTICEGRYRALSCDLFAETTTSEKFDLVVADPPWYPLETRAFLLAALQRSRRGTRVLVSVPSVGTRPGIRQEWQELLRWTESRGLRLLDYEARALPYISPLFERNALRRAGIDRFPTDWRKGDLATFEVDSPRGEGSLPRRSPHRWREVRFGRVRFRIRGDSYAGWRSPQLRTVVSEDILPSVSRRDIRLKSVTVWTSGNRVFGCEGCFGFWKIAEAVSLGECPVSRFTAAIGASLDDSQREEVRRAVAKLNEVVALEEREIQDWRTEGNENVVELPAHQS